MDTLTEARCDLLQVPESRLLCSIIVPVYNEEENVELLHRQITAAMEPLGAAYEVVYVDDGSRDASFSLLSAVAEGDPRVIVIQLRRNFGQTAALAAGMAAASGEVIVSLDADLQNDPQDIPALLAKIDEGYDVVSGWRSDRQDPLLSRRLPSQIANALIAWATGVRLHDFGCTLKAYRREVVQHVHLYGEMHRFIPAFAAWVGASIAELPVRHHPRLHGKSKYGLARTFKVVLDLLTVKFLGSYSTKPIYVFGGLGVFTIGAGCLSGLVVILRKLFQGMSMIESPLLLLTVMLFIIGVQLILMGLLAEIAVRTYHESQGKPIYFVRRIVKQADRAQSR